MSVRCDLRTDRQITFDRFLLDPENERLCCGQLVIPLTPKAFALLHYLAIRRDRLATKKELLEAIWGDTLATDASLKVCMCEIRKALGDQPKTPRFIETVHCRGYRFIADTTENHATGDRRSTLCDMPLRKGLAESNMGHTDPSPLVGRQPELVKLHGFLASALEGDRQVVFVTGESGIGKTALVDALLKQVMAQGVGWVARGQCFEHHDRVESYLPVLEALGQLWRQSESEFLRAVFARHAPTWLMQMPSVTECVDRERDQRAGHSTTPARMLREMGEAVESLTADQPLVLVLEDLQWGDVSTLDLIASLAQGRRSARLLLIGTYRPIEVISSGHPLRAIKQELRTHRQCDELPLKPLTEAAVAEYLAARFAGSQLPPELARLVHQRTEGNALFMVNEVDHLVAQGALVFNDDHWELTVELNELFLDVPGTIRDMIETRIDLLSQLDQRMLEAASVVGVEFSPAAVAAVLGLDSAEIEERCDELARRGQVLRLAHAREVPGGSAASQYRFNHALDQRVLYDRLPIPRRIQFEHRIGRQSTGDLQQTACLVAAASNDLWLKAPTD